MTPVNGDIEAEYEDGYIHNETQLGDNSPYLPDEKNVFNDILENRPVAEHGRMVRFSVFYGDKRHDVDWTNLPKNARPIRFRHIEVDFQDGKMLEKRIMGVDFGYQYTDDDGKNVQDVMKL